MLVCVKCNKEIKKKDDYFSAGTYIKGKLVSTNYIHKTCQDEMNKQSEVLMARANGMLGLLGNSMQRMGLIPEPKKEVIIGGLS